MSSRSLADAATVEARLGRAEEARRLATDSGEEWVAAAVEGMLTHDGVPGRRLRAKEAARVLDLAPRELRSVP